MNTNTNNQTEYENNQFDTQNLYNQDDQNIDNDSNQKQYVDNYQKSNNNRFLDDLKLVGNRSKSFIWIYFLSVFFLIIGIVLWVEGLGRWDNTMRVVGIVFTSIGLFFVFINFIFSITIIVMQNNLKEINKALISPMILFVIGLVFNPFALLAAFMNVSIANRTFNMYEKLYK